jgi:hypothetical protein
VPRATMNDTHRYLVDALMADSTNRHHHIRAAAEEEAERRTRQRYPKAVAILVSQEESWRQVLSRSGPVP